MQLDDGYTGSKQIYKLDRLEQICITIESGLYKLDRIGYIFTAIESEVYDPDRLEHICKAIEPDPNSFGSMPMQPQILPVLSSASLSRQSP